MPSDTRLRTAIIRLAHANVGLRPHLLPLLKSGGLKRFLLPVKALSDETSARYTGKPAGTPYPVWIIAEAGERRLMLDAGGYDGMLDKFMEYEVPENDGGMTNGDEVRAAVKRWALSPVGERVLASGHTYDFSHR